MPPKGRRGSDATMPLMNTLPASMRRARSLALWISRVHSAAPRPYSVSLANRTAWSASRARITAATGPNVSSRERTDVGIAFQRVAHAQGLDGRGELGGELIGDGFFDDEAFGGNAALAIVLVARAYGGGRGGVQIGIGENDERVRAAQLEDLLLELLAGGGRNTFADFARAGQRDGLDTRVGDQLVHFRAGDEHGAEKALRQAGGAEELFDGHRAAGDVRRVLEH